MDSLLIILPVAIVAFAAGRITAGGSPYRQRKGINVRPYRPNPYQYKRRRW
ncbi:MAG: hypothetical protein AAGC54_14460 [Cyanobacteria bacterium P01_F01_bin.4]